MTTFPSPGPRLGALLLAVACGLVARPAGADPCSVTVSGAPDAAWQASAATLADERGTRDGAGCARVDIHVSGAGARITYRTPDGRNAERDLAHPSELLPTVRALDVTAAGPAHAPPRSPAPALPPDENREPAPAPSPYALTPRFSLGGGYRGGGNDLASPVVLGTASLSLDRWELGIAGALELHYFRFAGSAQPQSDTGAFSAGVIVARREPVGGVALLAGGQLGIAALNGEPDAVEQSRGRAEVRLGAFGGLVVPERASVRLKAALGGEIVPHEARFTPGWALVATLGAEVGGP